jgi:hypothetical protein
MTGRRRQLSADRLAPSLDFTKYRCRHQDDQPAQAAQWVGSHSGAIKTVQAYMIITQPAQAA